MLTHKQPSILGSRVAYVGQNLDALLIIPVRENHFQRIRVGGRYFLNHVSADVGAAVSNPHSAGPQQFLILHHVGQVHDGTPQMRVLGEEGTHQVSMPPGLKAGLDQELDQSEDASACHEVLFGQR